MKFTSCKYVTILLTTLALSVPSAAAVPPLEPFNLKGEYRVAFNGIKIGRLKLNVEEDALNYHMTVDVKSGGIARLISDESSFSEASGRVSAEYPYYLPQQFSKRPQGKHEGDRTTLRFNEQGRLSKRERDPMPDGIWRPEVTMSEIAATTDPISTSMQLRKKLHTNMSLNVRDSAIHAYDGKRLYNMNFKVISPARVEVMGKYIDAVNTVVTREPIAGYTPKELKKYKEGDPVIHLYFSADGRFIPVRATVSLPYGELSVTLVGYN